MRMNHCLFKRSQTQRSFFVIRYNGSSKLILLDSKNTAIEKSEWKGVEAVKVINKQDMLHFKNVSDDIECTLFYLRLIRPSAVHYFA